MAKSELVRRARDRDRNAYDVLITELVDHLYRIARLVLRDYDSAEDAVQEALVRCWRDPTRGQVIPGEFIGGGNRLRIVALDTPDGGAIDIWVWDTAADFNAFLDDARVIESFEFDLTL